MPPPLPPSMIHQILAHLLPPTPPLPAHLLSRSLLNRLTFLPPSPSDLDAHLSPFPSSSPQYLSSRLTDLSIGYEVAEAVYAHDGEVMLAGIRLTPTATHGGYGGVNVIFEYEDAPNGRGWVYHCARLPEDVGRLDWVDDVKLVQEKGGEKGDGLDPEDYWAGFTPPTPNAALPQDGGDRGEDDYWAQYGTGTADTTGAGTPSLGVKGDDEARSAEQPFSTKSKTMDDSVISDKLLSKINVLLRRMWTEFTAYAEGQEDILEERAWTWLKLGRKVVDARPVDDDNREAEVLKGKMRILLEMYDLVRADEGDEKRFWRLLEEAIRKPIHACVSDDGSLLNL